MSIPGQFCAEHYLRQPRYLFEKLEVSIDQVYFFNTHFFPTLTKKVKGQDGINYEGVRSWTKRDDVFSYDYLVVPMHEE